MNWSYKMKYVLINIKDTVEKKSKIRLCLHIKFFIVKIKLNTGYKNSCGNFPPINLKREYEV